VNIGRPIRVLHVDDEEDQLRFTKMFLEELDRGVTVDSAADPVEALWLQGRNRYDVIVSDFKMAGMTGAELFHMVRARSDVPFILYTGRGGDELAESAIEAGMDGYVKKEAEPSHYKFLLNRIRRIVEWRRATKPPAEQTAPAQQEALDKPS
jgi:CheY-like chemotaxis protein